ncbi:androgen-induced gene 1 protein isoform X2 [Patella vulgata]|uniref:androgen-induced gene 1 protein isoform X2 n=1 Tax=Patella vulgata TaxID=6465 RepID=UPI00217FBA58|nr:androgen-induced gene 1 protein isoform X2 [Patella vulgata]
MTKYKRVGLFLTTTASIYAYALSFNVTSVGLELGNVFTFKGYAGKFKYLTFWNLSIQTIYFALSLVNFVIGSNVPPTADPKRKTAIQKFRDCFHATIVFPTGMFVVMTFWAIYAVDRELVYPESLDKIIPAWVNHVNHTFVLPILLIEKYLIYHQYPNKGKGILVILAFALTYLVWILWIAYKADIWVYPVLKVLDTPQKAIFIFFLMLLFVSLYLIGEGLTIFLWRKTPKQKRR